MKDPAQPARRIRLNIRSLPFVFAAVLFVQLFLPTRGTGALLFGISGAWLLSYLWARALKTGLHLERDLRSRWKQVGDRLQEQVSLENHGWAPALWVRVNDHSDMETYGINTVASVPGKRYRSWYSRGVCQQRGIYTFGPTSIETGDPLGVYSVEIEYPAKANMMVAPQVVSLPEVEIAAGGRLGVGRASTHGIERTVSASSVREYAAGDSIRWVHWPTTARKGDLHVHLYDAEPDSDWWVLLDMDVGIHHTQENRSTEEYCAILAASLANRALELNKPVGLISQGDELVWHTPEAGDTQLFRILRSLAGLRPGSMPLESVLERVGASIGTNVSLVIVTANVSMGWISALDTLRSKGVVPTLILVDPTTFGRPADIRSLRSQLISMGVKHYIFSSGFLDPVEVEGEKARDWWLLYRPRSAADRRGAQLPYVLRWVRILGLLMLFNLGVVSAISQAVRGVESGLLWIIVGWGMTAGWALNKRILPVWVQVILNLLTGALFATFALLRLGKELLALAGGLPGFILRAASGEPVDAYLRGLSEFGSELLQAGERTYSWIASALSGEQFYDPIAVALIWGGLVWACIAWAVWRYLRDRRSLQASLPAVGLVVLLLGLTGSFSHGLTLMLASTVALIVFAGHDRRAERWLASDIYMDAGIGPRTATTGVMLSIAMFALVAIGSLLRFNPITEVLSDATERDRSEAGITRALGLESQLRGDSSQSLDDRLAAGLPNQHLIGGTPLNSVEPIIEFAFIGMPPELDLGEDRASPLRYIRALNYDRYTGSGWVSREVVYEDYEPGEELSRGRLEDQLTIRQWVKVLAAGSGYLYSVGEPVTVDSSFQIAFRVDEGEAGPTDIFGGTVGPDEYRVDSLVVNFSEQQLREAGQNYPDWIRDRYIPLPASVPGRVLTLARELTAVSPTPYDRAVAIEGYLRTFPYNLDVPSIPSDEDLADYFLFSLREGYCDYYASAMVVLVRGAGLPARLVTGFYAEEFSQDDLRTVLTADQAHSWVEIYFPGYGWIPFEPTAGRPALPRTESGIRRALPEIELSLEPLILDASGQLRLWLRRIGSAVGVVLLAGLLGLLLLEWRFQLRPSDRLLPSIIQRLYRFGASVGVAASPGDSAVGYLDRLGRKLDDWAIRSRFPVYLMHTGRRISELGYLYEQELFNPARLVGDLASDAQKVYSALRLRLVLFLIMYASLRLALLSWLLWRQAPSKSAMAIGRNVWTKRRV